MLLDAPSEPRVSTGLEALDEVLGGLYWGDNVVWQLDRAPVEPFYQAIASLSEVFDTKTVVSVGAAVTPTASPGWGSSTPADPPSCCARSTACAIRGATVCCCSSRSTAWCAPGERPGRASSSRAAARMLLEVGAIA